MTTNKNTPEKSLRERAEAIGLYNGRLIDWVIRVEQLEAKNAELLHNLEVTEQTRIEYRELAAKRLEALCEAKNTLLKLRHRSLHDDPIDESITAINKVIGWPKNPKQNGPQEI